jgi:hypothetical protein
MRFLVITLSFVLHVDHWSEVLYWNCWVGGGGWDLSEWSENCASIPKTTGSNPSGKLIYCELTFRSDWLLTVRGGSKRSLFACLSCYPGNTFFSQRLEPPGIGWVGAIQIPKFILFFVNAAFKYDILCTVSVNPLLQNRTAI